MAEDLLKILKDKFSRRLTLLILLLPSLAYSNSAKEKNKEEVRSHWQACLQLQSNPSSKKVASVPIKDEGANEVAELYFDPAGNLIYGRINGESESGDHSYTTEYCFRKTGTLAFILRTFKTVQGSPDGVREERRIWIDEHKKKIDDETKVFDLSSGKPQEKSKQNYFQPDKMGWKTLPSAPEALTAKSFLAQFPKIKP